MLVRYLVRLWQISPYIRILAATSVFPLMMVGVFCQLGICMYFGRLSIRLMSTLYLLSMRSTMSIDSTFVCWTLGALLTIVLINLVSGVLILYAFNHWTTPEEEVDQMDLEMYRDTEEDDDSEWVDIECGPEDTDTTDIVESVEHYRKHCE